MDDTDLTLELRRPEGAPELLFLLLHGVGADADDLAPLAARLGREYPQALVLGLRGGAPFDGGAGSGRQWFSVAGVDEANRPARVAAVLPAFVARVRALQARHGIDAPHTLLVGFSQGAIVALEAVQAEPALAGRVLAFSGRHATPPGHAPQDTTVHLLHGLDDRVVPPGPAVDAAQRLLQLGGDVTADVMPGIGHALHPQLVERAVERLRTFVPQRVWRQALEAAPQGMRPREGPAD